jgi:hypothetical protein
MRLPKVEFRIDWATIERQRISCRTQFLGQENAPIAKSPVLPALHGRLASIGIGALGAPTGAWLACPSFGLAIAAAEVAVVSAVILTALYGSDRLSKRAFRLLRWAFDRSEPPAARKC